MINAEAFLDTLTGLEDEAIDLAKVALALSLIKDKKLSVERYENHLKKLCAQVNEYHANFLKKDATDTAETQAQALQKIIAHDHEYRGDTEAYDDLDNASLARVIDRRKGLPITLAIIYIHVGQKLGWKIDGIDFPGHFLCRLQKDGQRVIFDPFHEGKILNAADLRALIKTIKGSAAELSANYFEPVSNRAILLRLQNNIKYRQIAAEDYINALQTVEIMRKLHPDEYRLLLDAGVLYARNNQPQAAITALEAYIAQVPPGRDRSDAEQLLQDIRLTMN